jgi:hypothetical protein
MGGLFNALFSSGSSRGERQLASQSNAMSQRGMQLLDQLFSETGPLRDVTLQQALRAMTEGVTGVEAEPIVQQQRSSISREGAMSRDATRNRLATAGLGDSGVGIAAMEDIDRGTAGQLAQADVSELMRQMLLGEQIGTGSLQAMGSAAGGLQQAGIGGLRTSAGLGAERDMFKQQLLLQLGVAGGRGLSGVDWGGMFGGGGGSSALSPSFSSYGGGLGFS